MKKSENELFEMANDIDFSIAVMDAQEGKPPLQTQPFKTIADRMRLISELEKKGFVITKTIVSEFEVGQELEFDIYGNQVKGKYLSMIDKNVIKIEVTYDSLEVSEIGCTSNVSKSFLTKK